MKHEDMTAVAKSSQVARVGHDGKDLYILFLGRGDTPAKLYRYKDCPASHKDAILSAESAGRYLNQFIKGAFEYEPV